jgi:hypothetical protein
MRWRTTGSLPSKRADTTSTLKCVSASGSPDGLPEWPACLKLSSWWSCCVGLGTRMEERFRLPWWGRRVAVVVGGRGRCGARVVVACQCHWREIDREIERERGVVFVVRRGEVSGATRWKRGSGSKCKLLTTSAAHLYFERHRLEPLRELRVYPPVDRSRHTFGSCGHCATKHILRGKGVRERAR